jgi:hypothetical protein
MALVVLGAHQGALEKGNGANVRSLRYEVILDGAKGPNKP